jgi:hypothetical protein
MGLFLVFCIYAVLGFMLAWIAGVVAKEDVEIRTGVIVLVLTGVVATASGLALNEYAPSLRLPLLPFINYAALVLFLRALAHLSWKNSAIIALIYAVLLTGIIMGLGSCMR